MATIVTPRQNSRRKMGHPKETDDQRPVWETIAELGAQIPEDEWKKVPEDSSINYKQHLYGAPAKRV